MAKIKDVIEIGVAEFKARCTKIMPQVAKTGRVVRVLKRGRALVEIHPATQQPPEPFVGRLAGAATHLGDVVGPIGDDWSADGG